MADSCDTFVAMAPATLHKGIVFGKNSDRPNDEVQEVVYVAAADHNAGEKLKCTYIEIAESSHTHAVILSKPAWMWGAEMGANEHDVVIGNEAVWTKENGANDAEGKLLGMDLLRLGLERADSAKGALDVITSLLEEHGQGGRCFEPEHLSSVVYHNSFLIADRSEAWVLETAGKHWAAEKITDNVRNISNQLSVSTKIDLMSTGLQDTAKTAGYWDGTGDLNFAKAFGVDCPMTDLPDVELPCNRFTAGNSLMQKASEGGAFKLSSMLGVLRSRDAGICRVGKSATTASMVSVLAAPGSDRPSCHWLTATPNPACSVFKPFVFCKGACIGTKTISPKFDDSDRFKAGIDRQHTLYKAHQTINPLNLEAAKGALVDLLHDMEEQCIEDMEAFLENYTSDQAEELKDLFEDIVMSEIKFYKKK